jgi:hypothetical protein
VGEIGQFWQKNCNIADKTEKLVDFFGRPWGFPVGDLLNFGSVWLNASSGDVVPEEVDFSTEK